MITHEDKIDFHNAVSDYTNALEKCFEANREACRLLERECKDMTEEKIKSVLWKIRLWDAENEKQIEAWMERMFS